MKLDAFTIGEGGKLTVLLHGFLGSGRNLRSVAVRWASRDPSRTFLLPDLRGHGASPTPPPSTTLFDMGDDVLETAGAIGEPPFTLVGHSLGAHVALAATHQRPELVESVTILDMTPGPVRVEMSDSAQVMAVMLQAEATTPDRPTMRRFLQGKGLSTPLTEWVLTNLTQLPDGSYGWRIDRAALDALGGNMNREDLWSVVERRKIPMRCIRGSRSPYVNAEDLRRFEAAKVPVVTLEAGHFVQVDAFDALIAELSREWISPATT